MAKEGNQDARDKRKSEFERFVLFLSSFWGILMGISTLFPYSNSLIKAIPLEKAEPLKFAPELFGPGLLHLSPEFVTVVTTISVVFLVLWKFVMRFEYKKEVETKGKKLIGTYSMAYFLCGIVLLRIYQEIYFKNIASSSKDSILLILYAVSFCCITYAFMRLAMIEYLEIGINQCDLPEVPSK
jgi:hypothetical protein